MAIINPTLGEGVYFTKSKIYTKSGTSTALDGNININAGATHQIQLDRGTASKAYNAIGCSADANASFRFTTPGGNSYVFTGGGGATPIFGTVQIRSFWLSGAATQFSYSTANATESVLSVQSFNVGSYNSALERNHVLLKVGTTDHWSGGNINLLRNVLISGPNTVSFNGQNASTVTTAATLAITNAPSAGTNATINNAYSFWVQSGLSHLEGGVRLGQTYEATDIGDLSVGKSGTSANKLFYDESVHTLTFTGSNAQSVTISGNNNFTGSVLVQQGLVTSGNFICNGSAVFNDNSQDVDFRVEGDNNANMINVNAGSDTIGFGAVGQGDIFGYFYKNWISTSSSQFGLRAVAESQPASNGTATIIGFGAAGRHQAAFSQGEVIGIDVIPSATTAFTVGSLNLLDGIRIRCTHAGAGSIIDMRGIDIDAPTVTGSIPLRYAQIHLSDIGASKASTMMAIRQQGTNAHNRFNGATKFGQDATPTVGYQLDVSGATLINNNLTINNAGHLLVDNNTAGALTIGSNTSGTWTLFANAFPNAPYVYLTPTANPNGLQYWSSPVAVGSFFANGSPIPVADITFNWLAVGSVS